MAMPLRSRIVALLSAACLLASAAQAGAQGTVVGDGGPGPFKAQHLTTELTSNRESIAPGETIEVGVVLALEEKWHIFWSRGGDRGEPPHIRWQLPKGISAGATQFPIPSRLPSGSLTDFGYENEVTLPVAITASSDLKGTSVHLDAEVSWLVCNETCVPGRAQMGVDLPVVAKAQPPGPPVGALGEALTLLPRPPSEEPSSDVLAGTDELLLTVHTGSDETEGEFFPSDPNLVSPSAEQPVEPLSDGLRLRLQRVPGGAALPAVLHGLLKLNDAEAYEIAAPVSAGVLPPPASSLQAEVAEAGSHRWLLSLAVLGVASLCLVLLYRRRAALR